MPRAAGNTGKKPMKTLTDLYSDPAHFMITAHRGASFEFPENTALSMRKAVEAGADMIEFDLRGTADGVPVLLHDETLKRTSNGSGMPEEYPLSELKAALISFQRHQDRRLTLEYCMLHGVNTSAESAEELASFCRGLDVLVNLIPWNPIPELGFETPREAEIRVFESYLKKLRVNYTIRRSKGRSISGACGQLATETSKMQSSR